MDRQFRYITAACLYFMYLIRQNTVCLIHQTSVIELSRAAKEKHRRQHPIRRLNLFIKNNDQLLKWKEDDRNSKLLRLLAETILFYLKLNFSVYLHLSSIKPARMMYCMSESQNKNVFFFLIECKLFRECLIIKYYITNKQEKFKLLG